MTDEREWPWRQREHEKPWCDRIDYRPEHELEAKELNMPSRAHLPEFIKKFLYESDRMMEREIAKLMNYRDQRFLQLLDEYMETGRKLSDGEIPPATLSERRASGDHQ